MSMHSTGLGKGLGALIRETTTQIAPDEVHSLPLQNIIPNPRQPRREFSPEALEELAVSIKQQGVLQPILVRKIPSELNKYQIVAGERRWRASQMAGVAEIPVVVREFSDAECQTAALVENIQRENLNPIEEAQAFLVLKEEFNLSQEDLAKYLGKSRSLIANSLRLLHLPAKLQSSLAAGKISAGHARSLLAVTEPVDQDILHNRVIDENLSVRELEGVVGLWKQVGSAALLSSSEGLGHAFKDSSTTQKQVSPVKKSGKQAKSLELLAAQTSLSDFFSLPVKLSEQGGKGRVILSFNSLEELQTIVDKCKGAN